MSHAVSASSVSVTSPRVHRLLMVVEIAQKPIARPSSASSAGCTYKEAMGRLTGWQAFVTRWTMFSEAVSGAVQSAQQSGSTQMSQLEVRLRVTRPNMSQAGDHSARVLSEGRDKLLVTCTCLAPVVCLSWVHALLRTAVLPTPAAQLHSSATPTSCPADIRTNVVRVVTKCCLNSQ